MRRSPHRSLVSRLVLSIALASAFAALPVRTALALPYGVCAHVPSAAVLDRIAAAGFGWIRIDVLWDQVEPAQDRFDWSLYDTVVAQAHARGLRIFASIGSTPAWATDGPPGTGVPRDPQDFYDVCYRAARRYRGKVQAWGMWNEPNLSRFWASGRTDYVEVILRPGSRAVRAADPQARVCGPDLAHLQSARWEDWLRDVLRDGGDALDVVTHHVYPDGADYTTVKGKLTDDGRYPWEPRAVRTVLKAAGWVDRPFWLTETGFNTASVAGGDFFQGIILTGILRDLLSPDRLVPWVHNVFIYEIGDDPRYPNQSFGLLGPEPALAPKPGYAAVGGYIARTDVDDALVVRRSAPGSMTPSEPGTVSITVRNTGTTAWRDSDGYVLAPFGNVDTFASGTQRLETTDEVAPGQEHTFTFAITAPSAGLSPDRVLTGEWQMQREGSWWFGEMARLGIVVSTEAAPRVFYLPAVARTDGLRGTRWRSDLEIHNAAPVQATAVVALLEEGADNTYPRSVEVSIPASGSRRWPDSLGSLFGFSGVGALRVTTTRGDLLVSARTFTESGGGSAGQLISTLEPSAAVVLGEPATLLGLSRSADARTGYRTNLGVVSTTAFATEMEADLFEGGRYLGTVARRVPPFGVVQATDVFAQVTGADVVSGVAVVRCVTAGGSLLAYASMVDNRSGDPVHLNPVVASDEPQLLVTAAHNGGLNGTRWRTDLVLANPGEEAGTVTARFLPTTGEAPSHEIRLQAREVMQVADAVRVLFGATGAGAIEITPQEGRVAVVARTYNETAGGTFGQGVPPATASDATGDGQVVRLTHLSRSALPAAGFRTNLGAVNVSAVPATLEVDLRRADGTSLGRLAVSLGPFQWRQLTDVFGLVDGGEVDDGFAVVRATTPGARVLTYATVVDNVTGDPYLVPGW